MATWILTRLRGLWQVLSEGSPLSDAGTVNLTGAGVAAIYNTAQRRIDVTIPGGIADVAGQAIAPSSVTVGGAQIRSASGTITSAGTPEVMRILLSPTRISSVTLTASTVRAGVRLSWVEVLLLDGTAALPYNVPTSGTGAAQELFTLFSDTPNTHDFVDSVVPQVIDSGGGVPALTLSVFSPDSTPLAWSMTAYVG